MESVFGLSRCMPQIGTRSKMPSSTAHIRMWTLAFLRSLQVTNSVFDRAVDRRGSCVDDNPRESSVALARLFTNCCCVDVWRYLFPSQPGFTWTRSDGVLSSRIDLIGCPTVWAPFISFCDILPCPFSDHCGLRFSISVPDAVSPGPGLWKFNISILEEDGNCQLIREF